MGGIGGMLGLSGGAAGTGFDAPAQADLMNGVSTEETNNAKAQNLQALQQQQNLVNALQGQGGIQNQSNVFNQLQGVANGTGPNPAQAMLNQQTGANVANQAALMAGQRGAGANAGLMARQAGLQGGNLQQQAVGQGATMQANQSLGALGQMGGIAGNQVANQIGATQSYTGAQQAQEANLLNALGARNTAQVGSQSSVNAGNTALANTQLQGQQALIGGMMQGMGAAGSMMGGGMMGGAHGGQVPHYDEGGSIEAAEQSAPPPMAPTAPGSKLGGLGASAGTIGPVANGTQYGAMLQASPPLPTSEGAQPAPASSFGQFLSKVDSGGPAQQAPSEVAASNPGADALSKGAASIFSGGQSGKSGGGGGGGGGMMSMLPMLAMAANKGGLVDVAVSPGEKIVPPEKVEKAAGGKVEAKTVPGKAKVSGDDIKNDTVKTKLPPGTIVVPRTKSKDDRSSAAFVRATLAKRGRK